MSHQSKSAGSPVNLAESVKSHAKCDVPIPARKLIPYMPSLPVKPTGALQMAASARKHSGQDQRLISAAEVGKLRHAEIFPAPLLRPASFTSPWELAMSIPMTAQQVLDREFLEIRCKILEIAAALDRLDRAPGSVQSDRRTAMLRDGLAALSSENADRAEQVQMIFSRRYEPGWREKFGISAARKAK